MTQPEPFDSGSSVTRFLAGRSEREVYLDNPTGGPSVSLLLEARNREPDRRRAVCQKMVSAWVVIIFLRSICTHERHGRSQTQTHSARARSVPVQGRRKPDDLRRKG